MPILVQRGTKYLDEKEVFDLYATLGSLQQVVAVLDERGVRHPHTGRLPTRMGVQSAALRFMAYNPDYARQVLLKVDPIMYKWAMSEEDYCRTIIKVMRERQIMAPVTFKHFISQEPMKNYTIQEDLEYASKRTIKEANSSESIHVY